MKENNKSNFNITDLLIGSILGSGSAEKRIKGTRFQFHQNENNKDYLIFIHSIISDKGFCSSKIPELKERINKFKNNGEPIKEISFNTYTYEDFNWIYEKFYKLDENNKKFKIIPTDIESYLNPLTLGLRPRSWRI